MLDRCWGHGAILSLKLGMLLVLAYVPVARSSLVGAGQFGLLADRVAGEPAQAPTTRPPARIIGTLRDSNGPISDADIYLQSFDDEKCAKLFTRTDYNPYDEKAIAKLKDRIKKCSHDLAPSRPDQQGHYEFTGIKPGWYAMRFLWNIDQKPKERFAYFERNGFSVGYYSPKDLQGKYDTMAQGMPFYFSGQKDSVVDYDGISH
jgi:hypothetical protein